jgi:tetratricopeptide (TPR) repeat protein
LIVQINMPVTKEGIDLNVPIADALAQELDRGGKVLPIVWSMTDPIFREAALDGKLKETPDRPNPAQIGAVAKALSAEYVVSCEAKQVGVNVQANVELLRGGRVIWKTPQTMRVTIEGGTLSTQTGQSIARTAALRLQTEPWKSLPIATKAETSELAPGQAPQIPTPPVDTSAADEARLRSDVMRLISDGRRSAAILAVRDGIDAKPLDPGRRKLLVDTLLEVDALGAAQEARRAATLVPEDAELRVLAARAWLRAGKPAEAQIDLNEAMARQPESVPTRLLLAEIALLKGDSEPALDHADRAVKAEPTADTFFMRALCRATLGGADGVRQDLAASDKASPEKSPNDVLRRYRLAASVLDAQFDRVANDLKLLIPKMAVKPKSREIADALEQANALLQASNALYDGLIVPGDAKTGHARRILAQKLLGQTLMDLDAFVGGTADAMADARINLGDAIKQMATARETWSPNSHGPASGA